MKRIILSAIALGLLVSCSNQDASYQALIDQGYTDPVYLGYAGIGCGKDDLYADKFEVTAPSGARIKVVACSSTLKGVTIRHL